MCSLKFLLLSTSFENKTTKNLKLISGRSTCKLRNLIHSTSYCPYFMKKTTLDKLGITRTRITTGNHFNAGLAYKNMTEQFLYM